MDKTLHPQNRPGKIPSATRRDFLRGVASLAASAILNPLSVTPPEASSAPAAEFSPIPVRPLGKTGIKIPILGLGGDGLVSDSTDKEAVGRFLTGVLDSGVTFFDTAHVYGKDGLSEKNFGLLAGTPRRKEIFLATKTGSRTYDGAMAQVEESLRRLRVDYLDLIQVHHVCARDQVKDLGRKDGVLSALWRLQEQKTVRFIGLTGHPEDPQVIEALETYRWDTFMCFVNPARFSRIAVEKQLLLATRKGIGIIAMKTFGGRHGLLVGDGPGKADSRSLLRFAWTKPIAVAIPGIETDKQLMENLNTAKSFSPMSLEEIKALTVRINNVEKGWRE